MDEKKYWVALSTNQKIGGRTFYKLYKRFKNLSKVWEASTQDLGKAGLDLGQIEAVKEVVQKVDLEKEWSKVLKYNLEVLIYPEEKYPKLLKEIPDAPGILYVRGKILPQDDLALAVVGSRKYTTYGAQTVMEILPGLVEQKITIVSGLALGIDAIAHKVCLDLGGRTIGVLACGLDQIYPSSNRHLADRILQSKGAIISEFPLGMPALRYNFPIRNRIIAGLSLGTIVAEAANNSGSLLTAAAAIEYNREVFAVPGSIFSETSMGTNRLIKMGAKMVTGSDDILEELEMPVNRNTPHKEITADSPKEEILLRLLKEPILVDKLCLKSKLGMAEVNSVLIQMEIKGKVLNLGGSRYVINGCLK